MHHPVRAGAVLDVDEGRQWDHLAAVVAYLQLADLLRCQAELLVGLDVDLIGATEAIEVVRVQRAQVDLHGVEDVVDGHAMGLGLLAVDIGIHLRHVDLIAGEQAGQLRIVGTLGDDVLHLGVQLLVAQVAAVLHLHAEPADGPQALHGRRREDRQEGFLNDAELTVELSGDGARGQALVPALAEVLQCDEDDAAVGAVGETVDRQPREGHGVFHARMLAGDFRHALDHVLGAVQGSGVRQLGEGDQVLLVLLRNEAGRGGGEAHVPQAHQADVDQQGHGTAAQDAPYHANVTMAGAVEHAVERAEQPAAEQSVEQPRETVLGRIVGLEQGSGQRRRQGQRVERRDHRRNRDGQRELLVELPGEAGNERSRDEHRTEHQGGGDDRPGDFLHGLAGRLYRRLAEADVTLDVLHHDDGVIHHDADGQHQAEQRQRVERETEQVHHREGADQRHRHGGQRNDRGAPGLQEQDHHQHHQHDGFEQRVHHCLDGAAHEDGRVVDDLVIHALGEALLELGHALAHQVRDGDGIGARPLEDRDGHRWLVVQQ